MAVSDKASGTRRPAWLTALGWLTLAFFLVATYFALFVAPTEVTQQELFRVTYTHASVAAIGLLGTIVTGVLAALFLWRGGKAADVRTVAAAEVTLVFLALTIFGGMIYSRPTLGAYWAWDARLTLSAIMGILMVGYFVIRGMISDPLRAARVSSVIALIVAAGAPLNRAATTLFRTVHPARSAEMPAELGFVLALNMIAALLVFAWFFLERSHIGMVEARLADEEAQAEQKPAQEAIRV